MVDEKTENTNSPRMHIQDHNVMQAKTILVSETEFVFRYKLNQLSATTFESLTTNMHKNKRYNARGRAEAEIGGRKQRMERRDRN